MIPAGTWHNVNNTGNIPLKLYSKYAPPPHPLGTIHVTKADALAAERRSDYVMHYTHPTKRNIINKYPNRIQTHNLNIVKTSFSKEEVKKELGTKYKVTFSPSSTARLYAGLDF